MLATPIPTREVCKLLKTGQVTSYVDYDDGWYANLGLGVDKEYLILSVEAQYTGTTAITINGKTDNHPNICVLDLKTGLMWSQTVSASVGPASNGKLPWTTTGSGATAEGIFPYCVAANVAPGLALFMDWRIPNRKEMDSLVINNATENGKPDSTAFIGFSSNQIWTLTTVGDNDTFAFYQGFNDEGSLRYLQKTTSYQVLLVRGGI